MNEPAPVARVLRALTQDHHIRLSALDAGPLWDGVRRGHPHLEAPACACLVELLCSAALLQSRTLLQERLQLVIHASGRARAVVADSWPDGSLRGLLDVSGKVPGGPWIAPPGTLRAMRSSSSGQPYIGTLELSEGPIHAQIEAYLQQSEQVQASATLWCDPATGEAGGLLAEPLPACPPERLGRLVDALEGLDVVPLWERTPDFLASWVNGGEGVEVMASLELAYRCRCGRESLLATLSTFPAAQLEDLFREGSPVEVRCDYCGKAYSVAREELAPRGEA